jgi:hypothetical protein
MDTTVTVSEEIPPSEFSEFLLWVERMKEEIPEEYQRTARIDIGSSMSYDQDYPTCVVSYERPETPLEAQTRRSEARRALERQERYEREQYEQLKQKFDPDPPATTAGISLKKS